MREEQRRNRDDKRCEKEEEKKIGREQ